ncbi:MAG: hypothetical protein RLN79_04065 [Cytophagales bacterium]
MKDHPDTLYQELLLNKRIQRPHLITFSSILGNISNEIHFNSNKNEFSTVKISRINYLEFIDLQGTKRIFIDEPLVDLPDEKNNLVEIVHDGSLSFYRKYRAQNPDFYGRVEYIGLFSADTNTATFGGKLPAGLEGVDYFQFIDYPPEHINLVDDYGKKKLAEMTKDHFGLYPRIMEMKTYEELLEILKLYDSSPEKVKERTEKLSQKNRSNILDRLSSMPIDSISTKKVYNSDGLKIGDYIKYIGPGPDRIGIVRKITSSRTVLVECDLKTDPKEFQVRISDVELIIE